MSKKSVFFKNKIFSKFNTSPPFQLICKKNWVLNDVIHFEEGQVYSGHLEKNSVRQGVHTFIVLNKNLAECNFHSGSEYFDIPFN